MYAAAQAQDAMRADQEKLIVTVRSQLEAVTGERNELQLKLIAQEAQLKELAQQNEDMRQAQNLTESAKAQMCNELAQSLRATQAALASAEDQLKAATITNESQSQALTQSSKQKQALEAQLVQANEQKQALVAQLVQASEQTQALEAQLAQSSEQKQALEAQLAQSVEQKQALEAQLAQSVEQKLTLEAQLAQSVEQRQALEAQLAQATTSWTQERSQLVTDLASARSKSDEVGPEKHSANRWHGTGLRLVPSGGEAAGCQGGPVGCHEVQCEQCSAGGNCCFPLLVLPLPSPVLLGHANPGPPAGAGQPCYGPRRGTGGATSSCAGRTGLASSQVGANALPSRCGSPSSLLLLQV
jgi:hypothetical protein